MGKGLWNPKIIELEGMAMTGQLSNIVLVDCDRPKGWKKLRVTTLDGEEYETNCMEPDAAKRNFMVFTLYIRKWGKDVVKEYSEEDLPTSNFDEE